MKRCPRCGQTYSDAAINFCLNDGELLSYLADDAPKTIVQNAPPSFVDDSPPTEFLKSPRVTSETNWPTHAPPVRYQGPQQDAPQIFTNYPTTVSPDQTLAIVSIGLGVASMTIGWCCYSGMLLGPAAIVTGLIALSMIKKNPGVYGGRPFAITGIVIGAAYLAIMLLIIIVYIIAMIAPNL
ncbi:MAG: DUF4190 domain-containing protein [Pyrinomonadaceae bacterium]